MDLYLPFATLTLALISLQWRVQLRLRAEHPSLWRAIQPPRSLRQYTRLNFFGIYSYLLGGSWKNSNDAKLVASCRWWRSLFLLWVLSFFLPLVAGW